MRQTKKEEWTAIINSWKESGLNQTQYCKKNDIKLDLFSYYKCQLMPNAKNKTESLGFAKVVINAPAQSTALKITLPSGAIITGIQSENIPLIKDLLAANS